MITPEEVIFYRDEKRREILENKSVELEKYIDEKLKKKSVEEDFPIHFSIYLLRNDLGFDLNEQVIDFTLEKYKKSWNVNYRFDANHDNPDLNKFTLHFDLKKID